MNLRIRGPRGQATLSGLDASMPVSEFQQRLQQETGVAIAQQQFLAGFPPSVVTIPDDASTATLADLKLASGDVLTVRIDESNAAAAPASSHHTANGNIAHADNGFVVDQENDADYDEDLSRAISASLADDKPPTQPKQQRQQTPPPKQPAPAQGVDLTVPLGDGSVMTRRIIDSDNSCLFNAVGYAMEHSRKEGARLRKVIVDAVLGDPLTYTGGFLGKEPEDYCKWIRDPQKWGGAIELSILARYYQREIAAFDIHTQRCDIYGEGEGYTERAMLLYDGLHYDSLAVAAFAGAAEDMDITLLQVGSGDCESAMEGARKLVAKAHEARQFTDTATFTLRCGICMIGVKGEKEAVEHAKATGHQNFTEYS